MKLAPLVLACALGAFALPQPAAAQDLNRVLEGLLNSNDRDRNHVREDRQQRETRRDSAEKRRLDRKFGDIPGHEMPNQVHRGRVNPDFQDYLNSRP